MNLLELAPIVAALPRPKFNPEAVGSARHTSIVHDESGLPTGQVERLIPARFRLDHRGGTDHRLVFEVSEFHTVEVTVSDALYFIAEATGVDLSRMLQTLGALA